MIPASNDHGQVAMEARLYCETCRTVTPHRMSGDEELGRVALCEGCGTLVFLPDDDPSAHSGGGDNPCSPHPGRQR